MERESGNLVALPHFPQLKLPPEKQVTRDEPSRLTLDAIYLLDSSANIAIHPMMAHQATLTLVRHTIAARLFDQKLLSQHLSFCTQAALSLPVRRLAYPRDLNLLPQVAKMIQEDWPRPIL